MRIVSLCPSLTELVYDLGRGDDLVGITKFCIHPAERVESVEQVGGTKNPKVERIVELPLTTEARINMQKTVGAIQADLEELRNLGLL